MAWVAFLFTNLIFATIFLILFRTRLTELLDGARQDLALKSDELDLKSSLESSLSSNLSKLVELDALAEKIIEYRSHNARLRAIRGRQLISRTELEALETRLRELNEANNQTIGGKGEDLISFELSEELNRSLDQIGTRLNEALDHKGEIRELFNRLGKVDILEKVLGLLGELQLKVTELQREARGN